MLYRRTPRGEKIVVDEDAPVVTPDSENVDAKLYTHIHADHVTGLIPSRFVYANPLHFDYLKDSDIYLTVQSDLTSYLGRSPTPVDLAQLLLDVYHGARWGIRSRVPRRAAAILAPKETNVAATLGVPLRQSQQSPGVPVYTPHYTKGVIAKVGNIRFAVSPNIHIPGAQHVILPWAGYLDIYMLDTLRPNLESIKAILERVKNLQRKKFEEATLAFDATYFSESAKARIPVFPVSSFDDFTKTLYDKGIAVVTATSVARYNRLVKAFIDWFEENGDPPHPIIILGVGKEILYSTGPSRYEPWSEYYAPASVIVYRDRDGEIRVIDLSRVLSYSDPVNFLDKAVKEIEDSGGKILLVSIAEDLLRLLASSLVGSQQSQSTYTYGGSSNVGVRGPIHEHFSFLVSAAVLMLRYPRLARCLLDRNYNIPKEIVDLASKILNIVAKYGVGDSENPSIVVYVPYNSLLDVLRNWSMGVLSPTTCPPNPSNRYGRSGDVSWLLAHALTCCIIADRNDVPVYIAQTPINGYPLRYLAQVTKVYRLEPSIFRGHMTPEEILSYIPKVVEIIGNVLGLDEKHVTVYPAHADIPGILKAGERLESKGLKVGEPVVGAVIEPEKSGRTATIVPVDIETLEKEYVNLRDKFPFIVYELPSPPGGVGYILTNEPIPIQVRYAPATSSIEEMVEKLKKKEKVKAEKVTPGTSVPRGQPVTSRGAATARSQPA